jgi:hypothetical protein
MISISTTSEFLENKVAQLSSELEYLEAYRHGLLDVEKAAMAKGVAKELKKVEKRILPVGKELVCLKRQKKFIDDDLNESLPRHATVEDAYAALIVNKVMSAGIQNSRNFKQTRFADGVCEYYNAVQRSKDGRTMKWCHILADWLPADCIKVAHLVPKLLESEELSYFFGVGEVVLSAPNNGKSR